MKESNNKDFLIKTEVYFFRIRRKIISIFLIFVFGAILGIIYYQRILRLILSSFKFQQASLVLSSPSQVIGLVFSLSFLTGILFCFPFLLYQFFSLFKPALSQKEYSLLKKCILPSLFLFVVGLAYGFYVMRFVVLFYANVSLGIRVQKLWSIDEFLSQMIFLAAAMSLLFQIPVAMRILFHLNIINKNFLCQKRKYIYAFLLLLAVLLPPTDPISLLILTLPLVLLFEIGLKFN